MAEVKAWERQPEESLKAFEAFTIYRDMKRGRSLQKTAEKLGKTLSTIKNWSDSWSWVARVKVWEEELDRVKREAEIKEVEEMGKRQAQQAQAFTQALMIPVVALLNRLQKNPEDMKNLDSLDIASLLSLATKASHAWPLVAKMERLARGENTENLKQEGNITHDHRIQTSKLISDPETAELMCSLIERISTSSNDPGGSS